MRDKLKELHKNSYSPYSNYQVSAIVVMKDGKEFRGVNVENASYSATICAERNAILNAITNGYKKNDFKELYVMAASGKIVTPCFVCRQVINEFFEEDCLIHCLDTEGREKIYTVKEMCTYPFGEDDLK